MGGVDIRTVADKLEHSKPSVTMDIYSHLIKSAEKETADIMDTFLKQVTEKEKIAQEWQAKNSLPFFYLVFICHHWYSF